MSIIFSYILFVVVFTSISLGLFFGLQAIKLI
ncbi:cytochrome b6-f complex subunit VI (plastid) [Chondrus crispus]|uniref:Cytochrome b6-f complex subunit 6 n=1 Tax=Chondrus crispus TaxID=2769 RepID=M5DDJ5_CHOCR|nr:cytochrome b6-f complex subunit VI [Chondrus crispus]CCP38194.1 cytochrome b6-f complex subunit VI [Chondrus crispus]|eukprot:YP_007627447.1 cytochrome b6-f complex subunit VI (plastid) [Chondrus crispus]